MKKTIFAAIAAIALAVPATLRADEPAKEYNMVITLQNGTTITLGHNDIKNITFNGEEISISGNVMNTIEELQKESQDQDAMIKDNLDKIYQLMADINNVVYRIDSQQAYTDVQINRLASQMSDYASIAYVQDQIAMLNDKISSMGAAEGDPAAIDALKARIDVLEGALQATATKMDEHSVRIESNEARIYENKDLMLSYIDQMHQEIAMLNARTSQNEMEIADLQKHVTHLRNLIDEINTKIGN